MWYPNKMDIPTTYHINSCVTSYRGTARGQAEEVDEDEEEEEELGRKTQYMMPLRCVQCLDLLVHGNVMISDASIEGVVLKTLNLDRNDKPEDFLSEQ